MQSDRVHLDFYFDVLCPYAWRTSLWLREVARQRPVAVTWKQLSLGIVNQAERSPDYLQKDLTLGRLFIAAERLGGNDAVDRLYLALGDVIHGQQLDPQDDTVLQRTLTTAGLPADLKDAALSDETTEQEYRASHEAAVAKGGFGVPFLVFEGSDSGYFGPVVEPVPAGQAALELWDFTRWAAQQPYLWELKRDRKGRKLAPQHASTSIGQDGASDTSVTDACAWVPGQRPAQASLQETIT